MNRKKPLGQDSLANIEDTFIVEAIGFVSHTLFTLEGSRTPI